MRPERAEKRIQHDKRLYRHLTRVQQRSPKKLGFALQKAIKQIAARGAGKGAR